MSSDRYAAWIADQIAQHEPSDDRNAVYRLAEATAALKLGAGMVFGMMMPPNLPRREELSAKALAILELWVPRLDEGATEQLAEIATRAALPIDLDARREEHAKRRRERIDARIAKSSTLDARFTELERAIVENPDDRDAWAVLADFQQSKGDPRGELIALHLAGETDPAKLAAAEKYLALNEASLVGPLAEHRKVHDGSGADAFQWRRGYIHRAKLSGDLDVDVSTSEILELLLRHPAGRFLHQLVIGWEGQLGESSLDNVIHVLAEQMVPSLRFLHLGDFEYPDDCEMSWFGVGDLGELWRALPRLEDLIVQGNVTLGEVAHDKLRSLTIRTAGLPAASARAVSAANLPALERLEVWYGAEERGGDASFFDVAPLLARHDLPALRSLGLKNCEFTDEICDGIAKSRLLRQLARLDLAMGTMSDAGVDAMLQHPAAFKHLQAIDVSQTLVSSDGVARLRKLGPEIIAADMRDDGARYVAVSE